MRRPAERRAQATVEWLAVIVAVAVALTAGGLAARQVARHVAERLDPPPADQLDPRSLTAAVRGEANAPSLQGAQVWLAEEHGETLARRRITAAVVAELQRAHPRWGEDLRVTGTSRRSPPSAATLRSAIATEVRIVTAAEERAAGMGPSARERAAAGAASLAWSGIGALAQRIARPLGLAVGVVRALLSVQADEPMQEPGTRAGDVIACRPTSALITGRGLPAGRRIGGLWRIGVLRDGRLILDAVRNGASPCRLPAGR